MGDRYAVMGNPVAHSQSPRIHAWFAEQTGQDIDYTAIAVPIDGFSAAVDAFRAAGGKGLNITVPFKPEAWHYASRHSDRAVRAEAVNTLCFEGEQAYGDNTDGPGLIRDLSVNQDYDPAGRRLLLIGAGGAARGVVAPLLQTRPAALVIANRTAAKAVELAERFSDLGPVSGCGLHELTGQSFDLLINATAASLDRQVPDLPPEVIHTGSWCYDMMYGAQPTPFMRWAEAHKAVRTLDGLGMLVEQAAESFALWRGMRPDTASILQRLRDALRQ